MSRITNADRDVRLKHWSGVMTVLGLISLFPQSKWAVFTKWHNTAVFKRGLNVLCFFKFECEEISDFVQLDLLANTTDSAPWDEFWTKWKITDNCHPHRTPSEPAECALLLESEREAASSGDWSPKSSIPAPAQAQGCELILCSDEWAVWKSASKLSSPE